MTLNSPSNHSSILDMDTYNILGRPPSPKGTQSAPCNIKVNSLTYSRAKHSIKFDLYSFSNIWNSNIELNLIYIKRSTEPNNSHHRNLLETWIKQYLHLRIRQPDDIICSHLLYIEILLLLCYSHKHGRWFFQ